MLLWVCCSQWDTMTDKKYTIKKLKNILATKCYFYNCSDQCIFINMHLKLIDNNAKLLPFISAMAVLYGCSKVVGTSCEKNTSSEICRKYSTNFYKFNIRHTSLAYTRHKISLNFSRWHSNIEHM